METILLIILLMLLASTSSQERKRRLCGRALPILVKRVCPTPCDVISEIAKQACSEQVNAEWIKEKCCP